MLFLKKGLLILLLIAVTAVSTLIPYTFQVVYADGRVVTLLIGSKKPLLSLDVQVEIRENILMPVVLDKVHEIPLNSLNITDFSQEKGFNGWQLSERSKEIDLTKAVICISYDERKIPVSCTENSAFVFYYDHADRLWRPLERAFIDMKNNVVGGITAAPFNTGTVQFFAGVVNIEAEPAPKKGINIKPQNMPAINPLTGVKTIMPPSPNNKGTAFFSYPINLPAGINGLTPELTINYSSGLKHGNCGVGWKMTESSIQIKTRNIGVPEYDGKDTMLLDGKQLECIHKETIFGRGEFGNKTYDKLLD